MSMQNRIWIELDDPKTCDPKEQCTLANAMLAKLGVKTSSFWWSEDAKRYCYGDVMGYTELLDRGAWFNLDFLANKE